jgi:putative N6-adenine-specific DNA methylase
MSKIHLIATAPMGLESVVAKEIRDLGYEDMKVENGRVVFAADESAICRCNLWLRSSNRLLVKMGEFPARTFDELFEGAKALPWPEWLPADACFPVEGRSHKSQLSSVPAVQKIVKKALVESMKQRYRSDWFPETGHRYVVEVSLLHDIATLTLDTTDGAGLHKRGYRRVATEAPLRETMAAAMVLLSRWNPQRPLYDPFCGSGTILIEAAMIGWNMAPGLRRTFASEDWPVVGPSLWQKAREEAYDSLNDDVQLHIAGSDIDPHAIEVARSAVKAAGLAGQLRLDVLPAAKARLSGEGGCVITNPPYGERLGTRQEAETAVRQLGALLSRHADWSVFALSPSKQFEQHLGRPANKRRKLYNGRIECQLYQYWVSGRIFNTNR